MSIPLEHDVQEDLRTFPMYQRLRKINPYAYYSLNTQKQMQLDLRNFGSLTFFQQDLDNFVNRRAIRDLIRGVKRGHCVWCFAALWRVCLSYSERVPKRMLAARPALF